MGFLAIKFRKIVFPFHLKGYEENSLKVGSWVILGTNRGQEVAQVVIINSHCPPRRQPKNIKVHKIVRYASDHDMKQTEEIAKKEKEIKKTANQKKKEYELPIKIVDAEMLFDKKLILVSYKIDEGKKQKIDVKHFARDLSSLYHARVEMHQVSPRDEAKAINGLGPCGRKLCCSSWLDRPPHVTVKMVKEQGLPLSPSKTGGLCGRLMCCLQYEYEPKEDKK